MLKLICSEDNVNKNWLGKGEDKMFVQKESFSLDEYAKKNNLTSMELNIIKEYIELDKANREKLFGHFKSVFHKYSEITAAIEAHLSGEAEGC